MKQLLLTKTRFLLIVSMFTIHAGLVFAYDIKGTVTDSISGTAIEGVLVKALVGGKSIAYTTTTNKGTYELTIKEPPATFTLSFQHLAFENVTRQANTKTRKVDVRLASKVTMIREVSVKAPQLFVKKDTVSYNVASFTSTADRTIEDVLKKLPGVKVMEDGAIKYQGKYISQFSIEGLDALNGHYNLATRNLQPSDVNRVEMIENFQKKKLLQGKRSSDDVAMNLKLKASAKMKLIGTQEAGIGMRGSKDLLYHGGLTGMLFTDRHQLLGTLKANNWGNPLAEDLKRHYGISELPNAAYGLINDDLATSPPLPYSLYRTKNDVMTSLNALFKLSEERTLSINTDYLRDRNRFGYSATSTYYLNNHTTSLTEDHSPEYATDVVTASLHYQQNTAKKYIDNVTYLEAKRVDNPMGLIQHGTNINQTVKSTFSGFRNDAEFHIQPGKKGYRILSRLGYSQVPERRLTVTGMEGQTGDFFQLTKGETAFTNNGTSLDYWFNSQSTLSIWLNAYAKFDKMYTLLHRGDSSWINHTNGYVMDVFASPTYRFESSDKQWMVEATVTVHDILLGLTKQGGQTASYQKNTVAVCPSFDAQLRLSSALKFNVSGAMDNSIGDINQFLVNPIQHDYKHQISQSGILAKNQDAKLSMKLVYQKPMEQIFINGQIAYNQNKRNTLNGTTLNVDSSRLDISTTAVALNNISQGISMNGLISKGIKVISSLVSLEASFSTIEGTQLRQGVNMDVQGNTLMLNPNLITEIIPNVTLKLSSQLYSSRLSSTGYSSTHHQQHLKLNLDYTPVPAWTIYATVQHNRTETTPDVYTSMTLFDASLRFTQKPFEVELKANNLLNLKQYSQTVLDNLDRYTNAYYLNPREAVVIMRCNL